MVQKNNLAKSVKAGITTKVKKRLTDEEIEKRRDYVLFCCNGVDQFVALAKVDLYETSHTAESRLESAKKTLLWLSGWMDSVLSEVDDSACHFIGEIDRIWRSHCTHYEDAALYFNGLSSDPHRVEYLPNKNWVRVALSDVVRKRIERNDREIIIAFKNWGFGNPASYLDPVRFLSIKEKDSGHVGEFITYPEEINLNVNPFNGEAFIVERS